MRVGKLPPCNISHLRNLRNIPESLAYHRQRREPKVLTITQLAPSLYVSHLITPTERRTFEGTITRAQPRRLVGISRSVYIYIDKQT
jgi:hypothetical protein